MFDYLNIRSLLNKYDDLSNWPQSVSGVKGPHGAAGKNQLHLSPASSTLSDVFSITGYHRTIDLLCLMETWHDSDRAVLGRLHGATYNVVDRVRPCTADELSVNHGSVAIVAGADILLSPIDTAD